MVNPASSTYDDVSSKGQLAFLERISWDDQFRATLQSDPQAALAEYGLHVEPDLIPSKIKLPKIDEVHQMFEVLSESSDSAIPDRAFWQGFLGNPS